MDSQQTPGLAEASAGPPAAGDARLVRFACRVMLLLNVVLAGFFCYVVVSWRGSMRDVFAGMGVELHGTTRVILSVPGIAYWACASALGGILILLEALAPRRRITLVANAAAMVLFVSGIVLVEMSLRLSWIALIRSVQ